jgi:hypothetical protein
MSLLIFLFIFYRSEVLVLLYCSCSGCHLEVDFPIGLSSTRARLYEQHPVPSLGFGFFFSVVASHEHSTNQILFFVISAVGSL